MKLHGQTSTEKHHDFFVSFDASSKKSVQKIKPFVAFTSNESLFQQVSSGNFSVGFNVDFHELLSF